MASNDVLPVVARRKLRAGAVALAARAWRMLAHEAFLLSHVRYLSGGLPNLYRMVITLIPHMSRNNKIPMCPCRTSHHHGDCPSCVAIGQAAKGKYTD